MNRFRYKIFERLEYAVIAFLERQKPGHIMVLGNVTVVNITSLAVFLNLYRHCQSASLFRSSVAMHLGSHSFRLRFLNMTCDGLSSNRFLYPLIDLVYHRAT